MFSSALVIRCCSQSKHLNVTGDRKLVPRFMGAFSIVKQVGPLAYWLNLGICYRQVQQVFHLSLLKPFHAGGDGHLHPTAAYVKDEQ